MKTEVIYRNPQSPKGEIRSALFNTTEDAELFVLLCNRLGSIVIEVIKGEK